MRRTASLLMACLETSAATVTMLVMAFLLGIGGLAVQAFFESGDVRTAVPIRRWAWFTLQPASATPKPPEELVREVSRMGLGDEVVYLDENGPEIVIKGLASYAHLSDVGDAIEQSGYLGTRVGFGWILEPIGRCNSRGEMLTKAFGAAAGSRALFTSLQVSQTLVMVVLGWWLMKRFVTPGAQGPRRPRSAILGTAAGAAACVTGWLLEVTLRAFHWPAPEQALVVDMLKSPSTLALLAPFILLLGPIAEETFFRGYLFSSLRERHGILLAYALSTLTFALTHFNMAGVPFYVLYGLVLAWLRDRSRDLTAPIAAHVTINVIGLLLFLLDQ